MNKLLEKQIAYRIMMDWGDDTYAEIVVAKGYEDRSDVRAKAYRHAFLEFLSHHRDKKVDDLPHFGVMEIKKGEKIPMRIVEK